MTILGSVWKKLISKKASSMPSAKQSKAVRTSNLTLATVSSRPKVSQDALLDQYSSLWQLLNQRQLIEVRVDGSSLAYQTLVLAIDIQRGLLWLDDLFPSQHLLEIGDKIRLRHHRNGEQLTFSSPILAWGSNYGATGFAIMLPEHASYTPRRQFRRADMRHNSNLNVKVRPLGQEISYGSVMDISSGGLRTSVPGNLLGQLRHGALVPLCEIRLSDELTIRCSARVRGFRLVRSPHRHTQISLEFIDLAHEQIQHLQQFINNLIYLQEVDERLELRSA